MENRSHALIAGFFMLILGALVVVSLFIFGESREQMRELIVVTKQNVSGLNPQAQVRYRGIRVGKVTDIQLDPHDVANILIRLEVDQLVPLTRGTTAKLSFQGVTGIAHVLLEDGGEDARGIEGVPPRIVMQASLLEHLEDALPGVLAQSQKFLESANELLSQQNRQNLGKTLANLEQASDKMNASLGQLQKLLSDDNVNGVAVGVREFGPLMGETRKLVTQLQGVSTRVEGVLGDSSQGNLVPRITDMTVELTTTSKQLNRVLHLLEDSPQSLILGSPPAFPGPGEPGFVSPAAARP